MPTANPVASQSSSSNLEPKFETFFNDTDVPSELVTSRPSHDDGKSENFIMRALQFNMLLTCSVFLAIFISCLWCICHFVVKWCHQRSVNQYNREQEAVNQYYRGLGLLATSDGRIVSSHDAILEQNQLTTQTHDRQESIGLLRLDTNGAAVQRQENYDAQREKLQSQTRFSHTASSMTA